MARCATVSPSRPRFLKPKPLIRLCKAPKFKSTFKTKTRLKKLFMCLVAFLTLWLIRVGRRPGQCNLQSTPAAHQCMQVTRNRDRAFGWRGCAGVAGWHPGTLSPERAPCEVGV